MRFIKSDKFVSPLRLCSLTLCAALLAQAGCSSTGGPDSSVAVGDENRVPVANPYLSQAQRVPGAAREAVQRARQYYENQQFGAAETELQQITSQWPELSGAWLNLAIVQRKQQLPEQAEASLRQAVAANDLNVFAWNELGALLRDGGRFTDAQDAYTQALKRWPDYQQAHRNLGILFDLYLQQPAQALQHYRAAQALNSESDKQLAGWIVDLERRL
jgi:tetratricopeptide (TPR) repeat protein